MCHSLFAILCSSPDTFKTHTFIPFTPLRPLLWNLHQNCKFSRFFTASSANKAIYLTPFLGLQLVLLHACVLATPFEHGKAMNRSIQRYATKCNEMQLKDSDFAQARCVLPPAFLKIIQSLFWIKHCFVSSKHLPLQ